VASPAMEEVYATARKVAPADISVLLVGETGVGKEVVARTIHGLSKRRAAPMICINCGAVTETLVESRFFGHEKGSFTGADRQAKGVFEEANGGTLLLDEIGELSSTAQTALLRVLETKRIKRVGGNRPIEVDVRVLAATNRDLEAMCKTGSFREDLLFRLNVVTLQIPPLRDRGQETEALADLFLRRANEANGCEVRGFSPEVAALLQQYPWPGNVRELRNVVEHAVVMASRGEIRLEHLSDRLLRWARTARPRARARRVATVQVPVVTSVQRRIAEPESFKGLVQRLEDALIGEALRVTSWNKAAAARRLGMPLRTLKDKVRARKISRETHDPDRAARTIAVLREKVPEIEDGEFKQSIERYEAVLIQEALRAASGNKSQAARALQMPLQTLKNKVRKHAVDG
jgi:two-component system response regulator AtoC